MRTFERDKERTREGVTTHVNPLFAVLSSNGSFIVSVLGMAHHCIQSPLQPCTFLNAARTFVHLISRNKQRCVRRWKALHVWAKEEREDEAFEDAEPDVGGDGRDVERVCGHAGPYVRKRKKHEAMMCRILSDFTYLTLTKVFCLGDNDDDDEHT